MTLDYTGLRLLVTGGASGIGHAVASAALERGAVVAVVDLAADFVCELAPGERAAILGGNAAEIYSLDKSLQEES